MSELLARTDAAITEATLESDATTDMVVGGVRRRCDPHRGVVIAL